MLEHLLTWFDGGLVVGPMSVVPIAGAGTLGGVAFAQCTHGRMQ